MKVRFPDDLNRLHDRLEAKRREYRAVLSARGHAGSNPPPDLPSDWKEWWTLQRAISLAGADHVFELPVVAAHLNDVHAAPDFCLTWDDGRSKLLEVTEATREGDKLEKLRGRVQDKPYSPGDLGGRRLEPWGGSALKPFEEELAAAIDRKSIKVYAPGSWLLIYPNSNASGYALEDSEDDCESALRSAAADRPFERIIVIGKTRLLVADARSQNHGRADLFP